MPDKLYDDKLELKMGTWNMQILHLGASHSHGDTMVWLPEKKLVIAGDTAFHVRMLPIFEDTDTAKWIATWDKFEALGATIVIPGHGGPTDMATVRKWTRDYLVYLREKVAEVIKNGGSLDDAYKVDQSPSCTCTPRMSWRAAMRGECTGRWSSNEAVIPADAGIQFDGWTPAFAGVTYPKLFSPTHFSGVIASTSAPAASAVA